jgi:hypothetical protein
MAGVNKNFVVKNGLEVNTDLILADADKNRVGINTDNIKYTLHVNGGIGATTLYATGISTFNSIHLAGDVTAGTSGVGQTGQYLVRTGTGVSWQTLPSTRSSQTFTATAGQTLFLFSYTVGLLDVFINGVKLSPSEYEANDTATIILNTACFGDETVEFITYSSVNPGYGFTGIYGISLFEEGSPVGTTGQVVALNFVGAAVTATATGTGATVYLTENWTKNSQGIYSLNSVGVGTTNPRFALEVGPVGTSGTSLWVNGNARVTGILTVGSSSIVLNGSNNTINVGSGITINGNTGIVSASNFYANGIQVGVISATTIVYQGSTLSPSQWVSTSAGIHTLSNVGIGTTNPTSTLTVGGNVSVSGVATFKDDIVAYDPYGNAGLLWDSSQSRLEFASGIGAVFGDGVAPQLLIYGISNSENSISAYNGVPLDIKTSSQASTFGSATTKLSVAGAGITVTGNTKTDTLNVTGVSTFTGIATFKGNSTVTELGNTSYDGIRFLGGASNFALIQSDSLGNLVINSQSTTNRNIELNGQHRFYANTGNVELNLGDIGTTKVGSAITFTASTGNIYATSVRVGINTSQGVILTSPNGTKYQLFVENNGTLKTVAV